MFVPVLPRRLMCNTYLLNPKYSCAIDSLLIEAAKRCPGLNAALHVPLIVSPTHAVSPEAWQRLRCGLELFEKCFLVSWQVTFTLVGTPSSVLAVDRMRHAANCGYGC